MKTWNVYAEGYAATGESSGSIHMGSEEADTFEEACKKLLGNEKTYKEETNTLWGMKLYPNRVSNYE